MIDINKKTLGIIGGGQLGMFLCLSAKKHGLNVIALENNKHCSINQYCDDFILGNINKKENLAKLFQKSDYVIYETENINFKNLSYISHKYPKKLVQGVLPLYIGQDRLIEKIFSNQLNIKTAKYFPLNCIDDLKVAINLLSKTAEDLFLIKTRRFGYDGKGQMIISKIDIVKKEIEILKLLKEPCILEEYISIMREISIIGTYQEQKPLEILPITENFHSKGILRKSLIIDDEHLQNQAKEIFLKIINKFKGRGILTIEFFITKDEEIILNEIAPRVHNSGHHSLDNFLFSQFDLLIMNILENLVVNKQINNMKMYNILGNNYDKFSSMQNSENTIFYNYNKVGKYNQNRKMAHINSSKDIKVGK